MPPSRTRRHTFLLFLVAAASTVLIDPACSEETLQQQHPRDGVANGVVQQAKGDTLTACVATNAKPFVFLKDGVGEPPITEPGSFAVLPLKNFTSLYHGLDVDIIVALSTRIGYLPENVFVRMRTTFPEALYDIRNGTCDFGASSFTKTGYRSQCEECPDPVAGDEVTNSHACCLEFSDGYFKDGMTVVTVRPESSITARLLEQIWQPYLIEAFCVLVTCLILSGHLVWWLERRTNAQQFHPSYLDGVDDGVWWSFVTMTTVGYGDKVPRTIMGRFIACVWMIGGILMFGVFNGATVLAMSSYLSPRLGLTGPLDGRLMDYTNICTTRGSFEEFITAQQLQGVTEYVQDVEDCYKRLLSPQSGVKSVFYDRLPMLMEVDSGSISSVALAEDQTALQKISIMHGVEIAKVFETVWFSIAMPSNATMNIDINQAMRDIAAGIPTYSLWHLNFGFNLDSGASRWTGFNHPPEQSKETDPQDKSAAWFICAIWVVFATTITLVYITIQFGGLWLRRYRRKRALSLERGPVTLSEVPLKDIRGDKKSRMSFSAALSKTGIKNVLQSLTQDVQQIRCSMANSEKRSGVSVTFNRIMSKKKKSGPRVRWSYSSAPESGELTDVTTPVSAASFAGAHKSNLNPGAVPGFRTVFAEITSATTESAVYPLHVP